MSCFAASQTSARTEMLLRQHGPNLGVPPHEASWIVEHLVDGDRDVQRVLGVQSLGLVYHAARHIQQVLRTA